MLGAPQQPAHRATVAGLGERVCSLGRGRRSLGDRLCAALAASADDLLRERVRETPRAATRSRRRTAATCAPSRGSAAGHPERIWIAGHGRPSLRPGSALAKPYKGRCQAPACDTPSLSAVARSDPADKLSTQSRPCPQPTISGPESVCLVYDSVTVGCFDTLELASHEWTLLSGGQRAAGSCRPRIHP